MAYSFQNRTDGLGRLERRISGLDFGSGRAAETRRRWAAMGAQVGDVRIGLREIGDGFAGEKGGEAIFPDLGFGFDFNFGVRRGGVAEGAAVEVPL